VKYTVESDDGTVFRVGLIDQFERSEIPTVVRRSLAEWPDQTLTIRPVERELPVMEQLRQAHEAAQRKGDQGAFDVWEAVRKILDRGR